MEDYTEEFFDDIPGIKDYMESKRAKELFEEITEKYKIFSKKISDEERMLLDDICNLSEELLTTCCADHYSSGLKTGIRFEYKLIKSKINDIFS